MNKHPGFFEIIHTQSFSKNLPFRITPDGYKLFGKEYPEVKNMIGYFKRAMQKGTLERDRADYQKKKKAATEALKKAHADKLENRRLAKMKQQQVVAKLNVLIVQLRQWAMRSKVKLKMAKMRMQHE